MKTNTITTIVLVAILAFSLAACSKSEAPTPKISERTEPPKPSQHQQPTRPPLDQEAGALAEKAFSETWTQVGDSWFIFHQWRIQDRFKFIQIKGVTFQVRSKALSEADTLNGLQWKGDVEVFIRIQRDYNLEDNLEKPRARQWSDWSDAPDGRLVVGQNYAIYNLERKNGQWTIGAPNAKGDMYKLTKPSEEQIKNMLTQ